MEWTTELPQKKGWYFYQRVDDKYYHPIRVGYFAKKFYPQVNRSEMSFFEFEKAKSRHQPYFFPIRDHFGESYRFAGPIEKPRGK